MTKPTPRNAENDMNAATSAFLDVWSRSSGRFETDAGSGGTLGSGPYHQPETGLDLYSARSDLCQEEKPMNVKKLLTAVSALALISATSAGAQSLSDLAKQE